MRNEAYVSEGIKKKQHSKDINKELAYTRRVVEQYNNCFVSQYAIDTFGSRKIIDYFKKNYNIEATLRPSVGGGFIADFERL